MSGVLLREAVLSDEADCRLLARLTDLYARDAMGGGQGLSAERQQQLALALGRHPGLFAVIAERDGQPLGHALCVIGFSSFYAAPLCNIHDLSVLATARGLGLGRRLMQGVETAARARGCAKLTLEVREDNHIGRQLYAGEGYAQSGMDGSSYLMMEKVLA